jgi:hypothetical protein
MERAAKKFYGNKKLQQEREDKKLLQDFKRGMRFANHKELLQHTPENYFYWLHRDISEVIVILDDFTKWRDSKLKNEMIKLSREQLIVLRRVINKWLRQQSNRT